MYEGTWMQFLAKLELIDDVEVERGSSSGIDSSTGTGTSGSDEIKVEVKVKVTVHTIPLGARRATLPRKKGDGNGNIHHLNGFQRSETEQIAFYGQYVNEALAVAWYKQNSRGVYERQAGYDGMESFEAAAASAAGKWRVDVKFTTDEIRTDPNGLTESSLLFNI
jgi:hypothetical protein